MTSNRHNIPTEDSAILLEVGDVHSEQPLLVSHHDFVLFWDIVLLATSDAKYRENGQEACLRQGALIMDQPSGQHGAADDGVTHTRNGWTRIQGKVRWFRSCVAVSHSSKPLSIPSPCATGT